MAEFVIKCCAYCEKTIPEIVAEMGQRGTPVSQEDALRLVLVGGKTLVQLCPDDRATQRPLSEEEIWEALNSPIDLPPNTTALAHDCPMLRYDGATDAEAQMILRLEEDGGYYRGNCPECGMQLRSPIVQSNHEQTE
jgi:hypothetical protein